MSSVGVSVFLNSHILYLERGGGGGSGGLPTMTFTGRRSPEVYLFQDRLYHFFFFFFFNFRHGQAKETTVKNVLKVVKMKTNEDLAPQSRGILRFPDGGGRAQTCLPPAPEFSQLY